MSGIDAGSALMLNGIGRDIVGQAGFLSRYTSRIWFEITLYGMTGDNQINETEVFDSGSAGGALQHMGDHVRGFKTRQLAAHFTDWCAHIGTYQYFLWSVHSFLLV
ncbi:MAG: hypothetical protein BWY75_01608 [bacterium ADurb.Bin425]|nr:MAG: hypothetical protein BWY75_01608 [bacterium ADurb.Bin425]